MNDNKKTFRIGDIGIDYVKVGLALYCLGLFASLIYYSRFNLLALDLTKPQFILIGFYIIVYFLVIPILLLKISQKISSFLKQVIFISGIIGKNLLLLYFLLPNHAVTLVILLLVLAFLELLYFFNFDFFSESSKNKQRQFFVEPSKKKTLLFVPLFCIAFAFLIFPYIPLRYGGGDPVGVFVFTKTDKLPFDRSTKFILSSHNEYIESYRLDLLYESSNDFYFLADRKIGKELIGYLVIRLKKEEVLRLDYRTPKGISLYKGGIK